MPLLYSCPQGHQWKDEGEPTNSACPSCGQSHSSVVAADAAGTVSVAPDALPPRPSPVLPRLAGYEILSEVGRGGMGVVYRARQLSLNRDVALKMLLRGSDIDEKDAARFRAEAEAVARLHHPHIVQVYDIGEQGGWLYIALEYLEGGGLHRKLSGKALPPTEAAALMEPLARAVQHAHDKGVVHRDLKPANVLLSADGLLKIADFGLAKMLGGSGQTAEGTVMGTPSYMAPEQAAGRNSRVGPAADIWALGAILYELLTGRPPFRGDTLLSTVAQLLTDEPTPPSQVKTGIPAPLEAICLRCLRKEPAQRYPTAEALADDLRRFLGESAPASPKSSRRRFWRWTGAAACLALLLSAIGAGWRFFMAPPETIAHSDPLTHGATGLPQTPTWEVFQITNSNELFDRIAFPSRMVGYAASHQHLYKTTDGGKTWARTYTLETPHPVYVLHFEDERRGWMSADHLYYTEDGGRQWQPIILPGNGLTVVRALAFGPGGLALAAGREDNALVLFRRGQLGAPWARIPTPAGRSWQVGGLTFFDGQTALLALFGGDEEQGTLLRTTDGGDHWLPLRESFDEDIYNIQYVNGQQGWASGSRGYAWRIDLTQDNPFRDFFHGGASISRLAFDPHGSGFGVGPACNGGVVYLWKDGKSWSDTQVGLGYSTPDAAVVDAGWAFVLDSEGQIARYIDPSVPERK